jgi:hypothetical protein
MLFGGFGPKQRAGPGQRHRTQRPTDLDVTGDKALQDMGKIGNMTILSPGQLFERLIAKS